ncbi:hypothetical protein [Paraflavitalea speifideaquila]|uniref:hypothetical protein n=1 Tax=Paraflavitalea speifideaquila TaxID=3076558 RepID=UPI0028EFAA56|nr:hypothetical protein [Paraflavitalea speifideiaquila]
MNRLCTANSGGQWNEEEGIKQKSSLSTSDTRRFNELKRGVIELDKIPTKHYLKEELEITLQNEGFQLLHIEKVEYTWATEFDGPPTWMKSPFPWDWVVSAQKNNLTLQGIKVLHSLLCLSL